ncbi:hypothetical protein MJT46_015754 [Ovis ammon polii x Ovis aries]|nr:hypothetical protein MJT46_015754 [Ovis ammon polii x Ovis aries]
MRPGPVSAQVEAAGLAPPPGSPPPPPQCREAGERVHGATGPLGIPRQRELAEGRAEGLPGAGSHNGDRCWHARLSPLGLSTGLLTSAQRGSWLPPEQTTQKAKVMLQSSPPQSSGSRRVAWTHCARTTEGRAPLAGESWAVMEAADRGSLAGSAAGRAGRGRAPEDEELEGPKSSGLASPTLPWTQARGRPTGLCG